MTEHKVRTPPEYCQYVDGSCDQDFTPTTPCDALFLFPSTPPQIAATIETAKMKLELMSGGRTWKSWRQLPITGRIIFREICKASRFASTVIADVTTLNFGSSSWRVGDVHLFSDRIKHAREDLEAQVLLVA